MSPGELIDYGLDQLQLAVKAATPETVCGAVMAATVGNEPAAMTSHCLSSADATAPTKRANHAASHRSGRSCHAHWFTSDEYLSAVAALLGTHGRRA